MKKIIYIIIIFIVVGGLIWMYKKEDKNHEGKNERTQVPNVFQKTKRNSSLWDSDIHVSANRNRDKERGCSKETVLHLK